MKFAYLAAATVALAYGREGICRFDMYWNMDACQCFKYETCAPYVRCGKEQIADPRHDCECIHRSEVDALYDHNYDEKCEKPQQTVGFIEEMTLFDCDSEGNKICNMKLECSKGQRWVEDTCMCMSIKHCFKMCPAGERLDPRESCSCVDMSIVEELYTCEPEKTDKSCPRGFYYDKHACKCFVEYNC